MKIERPKAERKSSVLGLFLCLENKRAELLHKKPFSGNK